MVGGIVPNDQPIEKGDVGFDVFNYRVRGMKQYDNP